MTEDLGGMLRGHEAEMESGLSGQSMDELARSRTLGRARRARRSRTALVAVAAVAVVVVGGGVLVLATPEPVPPVGTTSPSSPSVVTPTPTPSATPTPSQRPTASSAPDPGFVGTVTVSEHLPSALPITPEVWADAGAGWVLISYRETWFHSDDQGPAYGDPGYAGPSYDFGPQVVDLVSPDGDRYQVVELSADEIVHVVAWRPQLTTALVWLEDPADDGAAGAHWARLDLVSGVVSLEQIDAPVPWAHTVLSDGRVPLSDGQAVDAAGSLGPAPTVEADAALAAASARYPSHTCEITARYDAVSVLVECEKPFTGDGAWSWITEPRLVRAWDDGSDRVDVLASADAEHHDDPRWTDVEVLNGTVVTMGGEWSVYGCPTGRYTLIDGAFTMLPGIVTSSYPEPTIFSHVGSSGSSTYTVVTAGCSGDMSPETLVRDDLATGEHVELVGYPRGGADLLRSLNGYYVVP